MDKKDWTPEELKLKAALDDLYETDNREPSKPLDLSFMDKPEKTEPKKKHSRLLRVAAIIAIALLSSFTTAIFISNDYASAVQEAFQRKIFEMKHGVAITSDTEYTEEGETIWEIDDFDVAVKAKEIVPKLLIPAYIPESYEFYKLNLSLYEDGQYSANYNYTFNNYYISIQIQAIEEDNLTFADDSTEIIYLENCTVSLWNDPFTSTQGATIIYSNYMANISTNDPTLSQDDFILIANHI